MKNTMKKTLNLVLVMLMLVSVVPVNSLAAEQWWMPLTSYVSIGDPFGCTCDVHHGNHNGQDFPANGGTAVRASKSGTVVAVVSYCKGSHYYGNCKCDSSGFGNYVKIKHSDGFYSLYAHLSSVSVRNGQSVTQGQKVGCVVTTGRSTGNHLHFGIYTASNTCVNPMNYINPNNPSPSIQAPIITDKPKIYSDKTAYPVGEKVTLKRNNVANTNFYWIVLWYNNKQILSTSMPDSTYTLTNLDVGKYEVYVTVGNSNGTITSAVYVFHVQNTIKDKGIITSDKKTYTIGETVTLKRNTVNNTNYYWIILWYKDQQILSTSMPKTTYNLYDLAEGKYDIFLQYGNAVTGTLTSEKYVFYVEKPHTHSYAVSLKEATYISAGFKTYMCSCGDNYTESIAKKSLGTTSKITSTKTSSSVTLTWNKVTDAIGYRVFQKVDGKWKKLTDTTKLTYTVNSLKANTAYTFAIRAYVVDGNTKVFAPKYKTLSVTTSKTSSKPDQVKNVKATPTSTTVKLTWSKVSNVKGYYVFSYNSSTKKYTSLGKTTGTSYTIKNLKSNTNYQFAVQAYKVSKSKNVYGKVSSVVKVTTLLAAPTLKVTSTVKGKANLTWTNIAGESGYAIYMSTKKDSGFTHLYNYKANSTKDTKTSLVSGKTYYFKVRAYKTVNGNKTYGDYSAVKSVKIK